MNGPHKFVSGGTGYQSCIFCEYCGLIAYQANDSGKKQREREQNTSQSIACPNNNILVSKKEGV